MSAALVLTGGDVEGAGTARSVDGCCEGGPSLLVSEAAAAGDAAGADGCADVSSPGFGSGGRKPWSLRSLYIRWADKNTCVCIMSFVTCSTEYHTYANPCL